MVGKKIIIASITIVVAIVLIVVYFYGGQPSQYINAQLSQYYDGQETTYYCAPASVRMVFEYIHYSPVPSQTQLAADMNCKVEYHGIRSASDILIPFNQRNLTSYVCHNGTSFNSTLIDVKSYLRQGDAVILDIWFDERETNGHFVVAYGYNSNGVFINDPWTYDNWSTVGRDYGPHIYITNQQLESLWSYCYYWYFAYNSTT
jgi:hypothetical protein